MNSVASSQLPVASSQLPVASRQSPVASRQSPVASRQLPVASCQLPVASCQLPVASCQLPVTSYQLPVTSYQLPVASYSYQLKPECISLGRREHQLERSSFCTRRDELTGAGRSLGVLDPARRRLDVWRIAMERNDGFPAALARRLRGIQIRVLRHAVHSLRGSAGHRLGIHHFQGRCPTQLARNYFTVSINPVSILRTSDTSFPSRAWSSPGMNFKS